MMMILEVVLLAAMHRTLGTTPSLLVILLFLSWRLSCGHGRSLVRDLSHL
jgi:hypothetical protein